MEEKKSSHQAYSLYPPLKIATNLQIESITGYGKKFQALLNLFEIKF